jgi:hypothetical protein
MVPSRTRRASVALISTMTSADTEIELAEHRLCTHLDPVSGKYRFASALVSRKYCAIQR